MAGCRVRDKQQGIYQINSRRIQPADIQCKRAICTIGFLDAFYRSLALTLDVVVASIGICRIVCHGRRRYVVALVLHTHNSSRRLLVDDEVLDYLRTVAAQSRVRLDAQGVQAVCPACGIDGQRSRQIQRGCRNLVIHRVNHMVHITRRKHYIERLCRVTLRINITDFHRRTVLDYQRHFVHQTLAQRIVERLHTQRVVAVRQSTQRSNIERGLRRTAHAAASLQHITRARTQLVIQRVGISSRVIHCP